MNVYIMMKDDGTPFYVGAGNDNRISDHFKGCGGRKEVNKIIAEHKSRNSNVTYRIDSVHTCEDEAFKRECELIRLLGRLCDGGTLVNITKGGKGVTGYKQSPQQVIENSRRSIERFKNQSERDKISVATKLAMEDPELRSHISEKLKEKWKDPEFIKKQRDVKTGVLDSEQTKVKKSKACASSWANGLRKGKYTDEQVSTVYSMKGLCSASEASKVYNMNPTYVHKIWRHERCKMALTRLGII